MGVTCFRCRFDCFRGDGLGQRGEQWTEVLSWEPRAFIYHGFLVSVSIFRADDVWPLLVFWCSFGLIIMEFKRLVIEMLLDSRLLMILRTISWPALLG